MQDDTLLIKCHNCAYASNISGLLKQIDPILHYQYILETFHTKTSFKPKKITKVTSVFNAGTGIDLEAVSSLPEGHFVLDYVIQRCIPVPLWDRLYYAPDFKNFVLSYKITTQELYENDQRLVIPFYNQYGILCGFTGRALLGSEVRYIKIKLTEEPLIPYGLDKVNPSETIYVTEGPIDSMFLPNAVASAHIDLMVVANYLPKDKLVLIFDNQYTNKDVKRLLTKAIDEGFKVCIWPRHIKAKDINDMVMKSHLTPSIIHRIIDKHTFTDLRAKMELVNVTS